MRSLVEWGEWVLRCVMLLALSIGIAAALTALHGRPEDRARGGSGAMRAELHRWSSVENPARVHVVFDSVPQADVRDWFAALPKAGTDVSWEGMSLAPVALSVEPVVDPKHLLRVRVAAMPGSRVAVTDSLGPIDSLFARGAGAVLTAADVEGTVRASVGGTNASAARRDSIAVRSVLMLGVASWEGKFVMASLEEHGWRVDARFGLAPTGDVVQGATTVHIDTSRYAAVIALDTFAVRYRAQIAEFVRRGGGFIATGEAAALPAFASLLPASAGTAIPGAAFDEDSLSPRRMLALTPLLQLKRGAVAIEAADERVAVAAWRVANGRVLQVGYLNSWRWRLGGGEPTDTVRDHRRWWSAMVSSVAYTPRWDLKVPGDRPTDAMPVASLVEALGPAKSQEGSSGWRSGMLVDPRFLTTLFSLIVGALLVETASRRLHGRV